MLRSLIFTTLFLGMLLLGAAGCSKLSKAPDRPRMDEEALEARNWPVQIFDRDLRKKVAVDASDLQRLPDGRLTVRAQIRNASKKHLTVDVRTIFKDESGLANSDVTSWEQIFLSPQQPVYYEATSGKPAARFTIEVREP